MTVDEPRHQQPTGAVDPVIPIETDPNAGDAIAIEHDIRRSHLARDDVEHRTGVEQETSHPGILAILGGA